MEKFLQERRHEDATQVDTDGNEEVFAEGKRWWGDTSLVVDSKDLPQFEFPKFVSFSYTPLEDITTYELAQIINVLIRMTNQCFYREEEFLELPEGVRRHFSNVTFK